MISIGEALARRKLVKVTTANGTVHGYQQGQYKATRLGPDDALLTYVDGSGAVCIVPVERRDGEWFLRGVMIRATQHFAEARYPPRASTIAQDGIRAIQAAFAN